MELSERIKAWREAKGMTRPRLAELVGVSVAAVYHWEGTGEQKSSPSLESLTAMVEAFGLSMVEFWGPIPKRKKVA